MAAEPVGGGGGLWEAMEAFTVAVGHKITATTPVESLAAVTAASFLQMWPLAAVLAAAEEGAAAAEGDGGARAAIATGALHALISTLSLSALAAGDTWATLQAFLPGALVDGGGGDADDDAVLAPARQSLAFRAVARLALVCRQPDALPATSAPTAGSVAAWLLSPTTLPIMLRHGLSTIQRDSAVSDTAAQAVATLCGVRLVDASAMMAPDDEAACRDEDDAAIPVPADEFGAVVAALAACIAEDGMEMGGGSCAGVVSAAAPPRLRGISGVRYAVVIASLAGATVIHPAAAAGGGADACAMLLDARLLPSLWLSAISPDDVLTCWNLLALLPWAARRANVLAATLSPTGPWRSLLSLWGAVEEGGRLTWMPEAFHGDVGVQALAATASLFRLAVRHGLDVDASGGDEMEGGGATLLRRSEGGLGVAALTALAAVVSGALPLPDHDTATIMHALAVMAGCQLTTLHALLEARHAAYLQEWLECMVSSSEVLRAATLTSLAMLFASASKAHSGATADGAGVGGGAGADMGEGPTHTTCINAPSAFPALHALWRRLHTVFRRSPTDVIVQCLDKLPHPEVRFAAYRLAAAIAGVPDPTGWNLQALFGHPAAGSYLLRRDTETTKLGKEAKFTVIASAACNPHLATALGEYFADQITKSYRRGAYAVDMAAPAVAVA